MTGQPEKVLLVTERPLLALTFREVLETAGWTAGHAVLRPDELDSALQPELAALVVIDSEPALPWNALSSLCVRFQQTRFVVWCAGVTPQLAQEAMQAGVHGLLSIRLPLAEAAQALRLVWQGERQFRFDGEMQTRVSAEPGLTPREQQVVALVMEGRRNREIADALHTTEGSVKVYMNRIFWKTGARNRHELAAAGPRVIRPAGSRNRKQLPQPIAADSFDTVWMFASGQSNFRQTGEPSYDSIKR